MRREFNVNRPVCVVAALRVAHDCLISEEHYVSPKVPFHEAKKTFKKLEPGLMRRETKAEKVTRKQRESIPLEKEESRRLGLRNFNKSADRMHYDRPADRQAAKELRSRRRKD